MRLPITKLWLVISGGEQICSTFCGIYAPRLVPTPNTRKSFKKQTLSVKRYLEVLARRYAGE
jgi:hypothetical protein